MWKKLLLSAAALGFAVLSNMHLCCTLSVGGQELEGLYSPFTVDRAAVAAGMAAEEIVPGQPQLPELRRRYQLSLLPAGGSSPEVSDALLRQTPGVALNQGVFVNSVYLGCVENRDELVHKMQQFIINQLPTWAVTGYLSQEMTIRPQYGRSGSQTPVEDMVLLISGMAPVMYSDGEGYIANA